MKVKLFQFNFSAGLFEPVSYTHLVAGRWGRTKSERWKWTKSEWRIRSPDSRRKSVWGDFRYSDAWKKAWLCGKYAVVSPERIQTWQHFAYFRHARRYHIFKRRKWNSFPHRKKRKRRHQRCLRNIRARWKCRYKRHYGGFERPVSYTHLKSLNPSKRCCNRPSF